MYRPLHRDENVLSNSDAQVWGTMKGWIGWFSTWVYEAWEQTHSNTRICEWRQQLLGWKGGKTVVGLFWVGFFFFFFRGVWFFIKHSIFGTGMFPFTSSISIPSVSSLRDSRSLGEGWGSIRIAAILMKRLNMLLKKRLRNRKRERMDPQKACP